MPKTKLEKILFSVLMSVIMVYGMEVYNKFLLEQSWSASHFLLPPVEFILLAAAVIVLEILVGGPLARKAAGHIIKAKKPSKQIFIILIIQLCTVCLMCPMMSMVASVVFKSGLNSGLFRVWLQTVAVNLPMALFWQVLIAGPLVRLAVLNIPQKLRAHVQSDGEVPRNSESSSTL